METLTTIVHIVASIFLIFMVLLQSGKGGGMGAAFGGGASSQIFGGRGAGDFLAKLTTACAVIFMLTSLTLSVFSSQHTSVIKTELQNEKKAASAAAETDAKEEVAVQEDTAATLKDADTPNEETPTADVSNEETPTADVPNEETPTADVPAGESGSK